MVASIKDLVIPSIGDLSQQIRGIKKYCKEYKHYYNKKMNITGNNGDDLNDDDLKITSKLENLLIGKQEGYEEDRVNLYHKYAQYTLNGTFYYHVRGLEEANKTLVYFKKNIDKERDLSVRFLSLNKIRKV